MKKRMPANIKKGHKKNIFLLQFIHQKFIEKKKVDNTKWVVQLPLNPVRVIKQKERKCR